MLPGSASVARPRLRFCSAEIRHADLRGTTTVLWPPRHVSGYFLQGSRASSVSCSDSRASFWTLQTEWLQHSSKQLLTRRPGRPGNRDLDVLLFLLDCRDCHDSRGRNRTHPETWNAWHHDIVRHQCPPPALCDWRGCSAIRDDRRLHGGTGELMRCSSTSWACKSCSSDWWQVVDEGVERPFAGAMQMQRDGHLTGHYCTSNDNTRGSRSPMSLGFGLARDRSGCFSDHSVLGNPQWKGNLETLHCGSWPT